MIGVTVVTKDAELDALHPDDYREIYDEIRQYVVETDHYGISLDRFVELVGSELSKAAWSKYHRGELNLNRKMKNELRAAVGLPLLPPSVADVMASADPNAEVVRFGVLTVNRILMVGHDAPLTVFLNGDVRAVEGTGSGEPAVCGADAVTRVTRDRRGVSLPPDVFDRVNARRVAAGLSWEQLLELALERLG